MDLTDKALNTLTILRNATWLHDELEIAQACRELAKYFDEHEICNSCFDAEANDFSELGTPVCHKCAKLLATVPF